MGGEPNNPKDDHPMANPNPLGHDYAEIDDTQKESGSELFTNGDIIPTSPESQQDQLPRLPLMRKFSHQTNLPPTVTTTPWPSWTIETLAMGPFQLSDQQHPRGASVDTGRLNEYPQRQKRNNSEPTLFPRAWRPSEPSTSLTEETTPQGTHPSAISGHRNRVYINLKSSEITDPSNHLPETDTQRTIQQTILEQEEKPHGNVRPAEE